MVIEWKWSLTFKVNTDHFPPVLRIRYSLLIGGNSETVTDFLASRPAVILVAGQQKQLKISFVFIALSCIVHTWVHICSSSMWDGGLHAVH